MVAYRYKMLLVTLFCISFHQTKIYLFIYHLSFSLAFFLIEISQLLNLLNTSIYWMPIYLLGIVLGDGEQNSQLVPALIKEFQFFSSCLPTFSKVKPS